MAKTAEEIAAEEAAAQAAEEAEAEEAEAAAAAAEEAAAASGEGKTFDLAYVQKLRAEAARHRREAREAQARAQQYEDDQKSDAQKLEERAAEAEKRATAAAQELGRVKVALKKGLTEAQAKRLVGETEEELEADADELLASFTTEEVDEQGSSRTTPRERLRPGAVPAAEAEETDPAKLAAKVAKPYQ